MRIAASLLGTLFISSTLYGDLIGFPDDLISSKGETKFELGVSYGNGSLYNCSSLLEGCFRTNYDSLTWSPGIRYGINSKTEIYTRTSWASIRSKSTNITLLDDGSEQTFKNENDRWNDLWIGINHRIWNDAVTPGLLVFLEGAVMENTSIGSNTDWVHGKTWVGGATLYRSLDPIILSATASYRYSKDRNVDRSRYPRYVDSDNDGIKESIDYPISYTNPGNSILINPSISFAANNEVSITSGFQWQRQEGFENNLEKGLSSSRTDLTLGMGYMWSDALTFHISTSTDMTGDGGSSISMLALYTLGKENKTNTQAKIEPIKPTTLETNTTASSTKALIAAPISTSTLSAPKQIITHQMNDKIIWMECSRIAQGWDKEILKCKNIDENQSTAITLGTFDDELKSGETWIKQQTPSHYTLEISIQNKQEEYILLEHLAKTRFTYAHPSHLHRLSKKRAAIALGNFDNRDNALKFLYSLPFVTNKSNSLLRTFGGLAKELHSLK